MNRTIKLPWVILAVILVAIVMYMVGTINGVKGTYQLYKLSPEVFADTAKSM